MKIGVTAEYVLNDVAKVITSERKETMQGIKRPKDASFPVVETGLMKKNGLLHNQKPKK